MQKRLSEILELIEKNIEVYKSSFDEAQRFIATERIFYIVRDLLLAPDKAFDVTFKDKRYDFFYPTTQQEQLEMIKQASILSRFIINECKERYDNGQDYWWMVTAFASGIDTLDMQIEIIGKEEHLAQRNEDGSIPQIGLNMENYQVNLQKPTQEEIEDYLKENNLDSIPVSQPRDKNCPCGEC